MRTRIPGWCLGLNVLALFACLHAQAAAPVVSNVRASQRPGTQLVDIYYDLADADSATLTISVAVSTNAGSSYSVAASSFTGALGSSVTPGSNQQITWNAGTDLPPKLFSNVAPCTNSWLVTIAAMLPGEFRPLNIP